VVAKVGRDAIFADGAKAETEAMEARQRAKKRMVTVGNKVDNRDLD